jgi:hypothetical protein
MMLLDCFGIRNYRSIDKRETGKFRGDPKVVRRVPKEVLEQLH